MKIGIGYLADSGNSFFSRQVIGRSEPMIGSTLEGQPMENALCEDDLGEGIASGIKSLHNREEGLGVSRYRYYLG